jgi:outer membrane protein OmpA-like peptidoglycan-associated protein
MFLFIIATHSYSLGGNADGFTPLFVYPGTFQTRTVYNLRVRENNVYRGAVLREVRERYSLVAQTPHAKSFSGTTFVFEELRREGQNIARRVENIIDGSFTVNQQGHVQRVNNSYFPLRVGFPVFPGDQSVKLGDKWTTAGDLFIDPLRKGQFTQIKFICEYTYVGISQFRGIDVHVVTAQYALRYGFGSHGLDPHGDRDLQRVSGSHRITIYLRTEDSRPFFIQNNIDETYTYSSSTVTIQGFSHTWYTDVIPMRRDVVKRDILESITESIMDNEDFEVVEREKGISLTTNNIHFVPDRAELLAGEDKKIEIISTILKRIPDRTFLVVGHTADVGTRESQMELSVQRAERIARLLERSGIAADRIIFMGRGGTEPVADNSTEEGRAKNRRVEIIILED